MALPQSYPDQLKDTVIDIALWLFQRWENEGRSCFVVGVTGAQGTGKSTLSAFLRDFLEVAGLRVMIVSIDDLYWPQEHRLDLARTRHPLLATRGVPGTHEIELALALFEQARGIDSEEISWPRFNKAIDDRESMQMLRGPVDIVLFEGWCVGCPPLEPRSLDAPINKLERLEDPLGIWRKGIQQALSGSYRRVFDSLDALIMLKAPSFEKVFSWRRLQEEKLGQSLGTENTQNLRIMNDQELHRFIEHYERLTRHMLDVLPDYADVVIEIDEDHRMRKARFV